MFEIKIPSMAWPFRRYGLLVNDEDAALVSWQRGSFQEIARFPNDSAGIARFAEYLKESGQRLRERPIHILANVIGEDYRFEKTPHLIGKFRYDFFQRKIPQLFRGAQYTQAIVQGREELGRREDLVLFFGILTTEKVQPWVREIEKADMSIAGVNGISLLSQQSLKATGISGPHIVLVTMHESGLLRQIYYADSKIRFSRLTKVRTDTPEELAKSLKKEGDRMLQYLNSLKLTSGNVKMESHVICPSAELAQLRELVPNTERLRFNFHDAAAIGRTLGIRTPMGDLGRDTSLQLHSMFSSLRIGQMAAFNQIRYYWMRLGCTAVSFVFGLYLLLALWGGGLGFLGAWTNYQSENNELQAKVEQLRNNYRRQITAFGEAPSSPSNMRAVDGIFGAARSEVFSPGPLMLYISKAISRNPSVRLESYEWYLTDSESGSTGSDMAYLSGKSVYQVVVLKGNFQQGENAPYQEVLDAVEQFLTSFEDRPDVLVDPVLVPARTTAQGQLSGTVGEGGAIADELQGREFEVRVLWKQFDEEEITENLRRRI